MKKLIINIAIILCFASTSFAQNVTLKGKVIDPASKEGIPFCNVYFEGTTLGTTTDLDGFYTFSVVPPSDSLMVSAIGYQRLKLPITKETEQTIDFKLITAGLTFNEVVVLAGENPANRLVRGIIKNKKQHHLARKKAYQFEAYEKIEIDLYNIKDKFMKSKFAKPFSFTFDNIDSTDGKPHLPTFLIETLHNEHFIQPNRYKKTIFAQKESGINNASVIEMLDKFHEEVDVYQNWITILEKNFLSPFAGAGLGGYEYYINDSTFIDGQRHYQLRFKPKRKQENTFYGTFWVVDSIFAVRSVEMAMSQDANINFIEAIQIKAFFEFNGQYWLPAKKEMILDLVPAKKAPGIIGRKTIMFKDYIFKKSEILTAFTNPKKISRIDYIKEDAFWKSKRHDTLSQKEEGIYVMMDSLKNTPAFKRYRNIGHLLLIGMYKIYEGNQDLGPVEIGPYFQFYNRNIAEGHRFQLGIRSDFLDRTIRAEFSTAYGTKDNVFKYDARIRWKAKDNLLIGATYTNDIINNIDNQLGVLTDNTLTRTFRRNVPFRLLKMKESKIFVDQTWEGGWVNHFAIKNQFLDPMGKLYANGDGFNFKYLPNRPDVTQPDTTIRTTEIVFKTKFSKGEKKIGEQFNEFLIGFSHLPVIELTYKAGIKGILGGQFNYHKFQLNIRQRMHTSPFGRLYYNLDLGKIFGTLPSLTLHTHPGHETFFHNEMGFSAMNLYEFTSDQYANLMVEYHFDGYFLNKIPLLRKLNWRSVGIFRSAYGTLSESNQAVNRLNTSDLGGTIPIRAPKNPYVEVGFGVENIFKLLRVDAIWRLNYLDNPEAVPFTLQFGVDVSF